MSGLGALWGFVKSKLGSAAFLDVGTGANNVVQLNDSAQLPALDGSLLTNVGGGATIEGAWDYEVDSEDDLTAALADANSRILITGSFSLTGDIACAAGWFVIGRKDYSVITTSTYKLTAASAVDIEIIDPSWDSRTVAPFISGTNFVDGASTNFTLRGYYSQTVTASNGGTGSSNTTLLSGARLVCSGAYAARLYGRGSCPRILLVGGDAAARFQVNVPGAIEMSGTYRFDDGSTASSSNYSVQLLGSWSNLESAYSVSAPTTAGRTVISVLEGAVLVGGGQPGSSTYSQAPIVGAFGRAKVVGFGGSSGFVLDLGSTTARPTLEGCRIQDIRVQTGAIGAVLIGGSLGLSNVGTITVPSACKLIAQGLEFSYNVTFASGSGPVLDGCGINSVSTLTLDSGAAARITSASGAGTITNNDPTSVVTLSENPAWDTTPSTRRYGTGALDALLDNHVAYWSGKSSPCPNKAPLTACNAGGNLFTVIGNVLSVSDAFDLVDPTDQMMAILNGWAPGYGPFTLRLDIDLDVASGGEENIIGDGTGNFSLNLLSSGALRIYVGATYYDTSSSAITTGAGNQRVTLERTDTTLKIYVNGVQVLTTTDSSLIAPINYFYLGGVGANSIDGKVKKITLLNTGIADATEQLWDTYSLVGAGA